MFASQIVFFFLSLLPLLTTLNTAADVMVLTQKLNHVSKPLFSNGNNSFHFKGLKTKALAIV